MSDQRPEPTTDDRWPAGARVGRLDLSSHLGADTGERPLPTGYGSVALSDERPAQVAETAREAATTPAGHLAARSGGRALPLILPPARIGEELAAEAARLRRRDLDPPNDPPDDPPAPEEPVGGEALAEEAPARPAPRRSRFRRRTASAPALPPPALEPHAPEALVEPETPEAPVLHRSTGDPAPDRPEPTQADELADALRAHPEAAAAFRAQAGGPASADVIQDLIALDGLGDDPDDADDGWVPPLEEPAATDGSDRLDLDREVAEVASSVIAAMRALGEANEAHLEAVEAEAARRHELLTAQAELDAELIRLHARREAHAIIAAARLRTGATTTTTATDQLGEIGETFSRFAESVETMIGLGPASDPGRSHP